MRVNYLTFIEHPETQIADVIISNNANGEEILLFWMQQLLLNSSSDWNLLSLDKIGNNSQTSHWLARVRESFKFYSGMRPSHEAFVVPLRGSWDEYLSTQSVRFRKTLRNIANRINRLGSIEVKSFSGCEVVKEAIPSLFSVSKASWKVSDGVAITSSMERMQFFEELSQGSTTADGLRIVILNVNGQAIASETQVLDGETIYALRSDYDERYADSSPGTYLQMNILQEMFGGSYKEYNFGVGLNQYKTRWAQDRIQLINFQLYNNSLYGRFLYFLDRLNLQKFLTLPGHRVIDLRLKLKHS